MNSNEFLKDFTFVEADESTDILKFKAIEEVESLDKEDSLRNYLKRKIDYFTTPTEIFARCFEIYLLEKGYTSSFSKASKDDLTLNYGYPKLSASLINEIIKYLGKDVHKKKNIRHTKNIFL